MKTFQRVHSTTAKNCLISFRKLKGRIILFFLMALFATTAHAQPPDDANLSIQNGAAAFTVVIPDTASLTHLEVNLGTHENATDLFSHTFIYDQSSGLSSGMSYLRQGKTITLGLGTIDSSDTYFARVRLKHSGQWSDWFSFLAN